MINRRTLRPSSPTEQLRQMSLTSSAGVSNVKAPTDNESVYFSKNFVTNLDGSISLRKPIILRTKFVDSIRKIIPLRAKDACIAIGTFNGTDGFTILDSSLNPAVFHMIWEDVRGNEHIHRVSYDAGDVVPSEYLNLSDCTYAHTSSSTILGNCLLNVSTETFPGAPQVTYEESYPILDSTLYTQYDDDGVVDTTHSIYNVPRCVGVYWDTSTSVWVVKLYTPEMNVYTTSDSTASVPVNTLLDNPFAARDNYNVAFPKANVIRTYVPTDLQNGTAVPVGGYLKQSDVVKKHTKSKTFLANFKNSIKAERTESKVKLLQKGKDFHRYAQSIKYASHVPVTLVEKTFLGFKYVISAAVDISWAVHYVWWAASETDDVQEYESITDPQFSCNIILDQCVKKLDGADAYLDLSDALFFANALENWKCEFTGTADTIKDQLPFTQTILKQTFNSGDAPLGGFSYTKKDFKDVSELAVRLLDSSASGKDSTYLESYVGAGSDIFEGKKAALQKFHRGGDEPQVVKFNITILATYSIPIPGTKSKRDYTDELRLVLEWYAPESEVEVDIGNLTVAQLTESAVQKRFRASEGDVQDVPLRILKAFIDIPSDKLGTAPFETDSLGDSGDVLAPLFCSWEYSLDGVTWQSVYLNEPDTIQLEVPADTPIFDTELDTAPETSSRTVSARFLKISNPNTDLVQDRADCLVLTSESPNAVAYRFRLFVFQSYGYSSRKYLLCSTVTTYKVPLLKPSFEEFYLNNACTANIVHRNSRMFFYGSALQNNILYTYAGDLIAPVANTITLNVNPTETVTALVNWRNSIIIATTSSIYRADQTSDGFLTKTVNSSLGVPISDSACAVPILNGVLFKSGARVFQLYPNVYSDDTVLNVTDVSKDIHGILEELDVVDIDSDSAKPVFPFAFSTESEYVLMLPRPSMGCTYGLRYNYETRMWTVHEYPVVFNSVNAHSISNIELYGKLPKQNNLCIFKFDSDISDLNLQMYSDKSSEVPYGDIIDIADIPNDARYGTTLTDTAIAVTKFFESDSKNCITPISFELDTGQKTDSILTTKQFVESKFVVATAHEDDTFPMKLVVHIDGDPHLITRDLSTDAAFVKSASERAVLGTTFSGLSESSDTLNTLRQLVVRYSGKGKSIRHILSGESFRNFKLYETYIRYKSLNVKQ